MRVLSENQSELNNLLDQPSPNGQDPITAIAAIPGTGMTQPKGKWSWEQPALITDPDQAVDAVMDQFEERYNKANVLKLMVAGVSVEEIVNITLFNAFVEGKFTPDVAEIIKPAVSIGLIKLAADAHVPFRMFSDPSEEKEISDVDMFKIMKDRNPEIYEGIKENVNLRIREGKKPRPPQQPPVVKQLSEQSFLEVGDN